MSGISEETLKRIIKIFEERGVNKSCPRCGHGQFSIITEGYTTLVIQPPDLSSIAIQGSHLPSVATICAKCGFISLHSLAVLGIHPEKEAKKQ